MAPDNRKQKAITRAVYMLRNAAKYVDTNYGAKDGTLFYDEAICDGHCLVDDLEIAADDLEPHAD